MTAKYAWVQWNRHKKIYDLVAAGTVVAFIASFVSVGLLVHRPPEEISPPILVLRALGVCAVLMLHVILAIGPLARLDDRFLPLLYNRRHLGVMFFLIALLHAFIAVGFYGGFGVENPLVAVLSGSGRSPEPLGVPFELLGFVALLVFFVMAATSHDFWLANLGPRAWKALHMAVYAAYVLVVLHVLLGALQSERSALYPVLVGVGVLTIGSLHIVAGLRGRAPVDTALSEGWIDAGAIEEIPLRCARIVRPAGSEGIAVFRHDDGVSAVTNVCAHQGGPLGEGRVVDGCVTCPWHGYQYEPGSGRSPPPYTEMIATHDVRIVAGRVKVQSKPNPPGTRVEPAREERGDG